ncbi:MAG: LysM peptidoglycan-binding domain-containing protein [Acidobacteria bacterium]|nr:MAG: LysM peptidoglycan-binding domain-containing protein [Acidobacteriota bacterium]
MALDLRRSRKRACRRWLEKTLLYLEGRRVLEASYERWPPHYHVAVFPKPYARYVRSLASARRAAGRSHLVARGESLWQIARRYDTSIRLLKETNGLRGDVIRPGQVLRIPPGGG